MSAPDRPPLVEPWRVEETDDILSVEPVSADGPIIASFNALAHVDIHVRKGVQRDGNVRKPLSGNAALPGVALEMAPLAPLESALY